MDKEIYDELQKINHTMSQGFAAAAQNSHRVELTANAANQKADSVQAELTEHKETTDNRFNVMSSRQWWIIGSLILGAVVSIAIALL